LTRSKKYGTIQQKIVHVENVIMRERNIRIMNINKDKLVRLIAKRGRFTLSDSRIFLDVLIEILEQTVLNRWTFRVGGLGIIKYTSFVGGKKEMPTSGVKDVLTEKDVRRSERIYFALSENITGKARDRLRAEEAELE